MDDTIRTRVDAVLASAAGAWDALVEALRTAAPEDLRELASHSAEGVRGAVARACAGHDAPERLELVRALCRDEEVSVRTYSAEAVRRAPAEHHPDEVVAGLLDDSDSDVRELAVKAAAQRPGMHPRLRELLDEDGDWEVRQAAAEALRHSPLEDGPVLFQAFSTDNDEDVSRACATSLELLFELAEWEVPGFDPPPLSLTKQALARVQHLGVRRFPRLGAWLTERVRTEYDVELLATYGTNLSLEAAAGRLPRGHQLDELAGDVERLIRAEGGSRSVLLTGESGVGKTALVNELVHRLRRAPEGPWCVVRATPSELLSGTKYLGEWQTKIRELVEALEAPKRVLLYVPAIETLSRVGASSSSDSNIAEQLAPHIESGRVVLLGETTPEAWDKSGTGRTSLGRLLTRLELKERDRESTRELLELVATEADRELSEGFLDRLMELADFYLTGTRLPGRPVGLLRRVLESTDAENISIKDVLEMLERSTGVPIDVLDDEVALDVDLVRDFLAERVMGQPKAVERLLELVLLVKAGLTDPSRPYGVFLFIGPTGVGKTELARSLAELLFGTPERIVRLDMSEYASYEGFERLLGGPGRRGALTGPVRENPFSVVLLDEIEKAHNNVFDLCLQIFDAGRLTDGGGTVDFRNTIVILTSNIGSAVRTEARVGFGHEKPAPPSRESTLQDLRRHFRPEFLGRLDDIVHFGPLSEETAERIARREVERVLERSGIVRRQLAIAVDPSVYSLLLREGYSPAFGARPLKRTVERRVLLPVARELATGRALPGAILRLHARGGDVRVEIVEAGAGEAIAEEPESLEAGRVRARLENLVERATTLEERKQELIQATNAPDFWGTPRAARTTLDELHRVDRVIEDVERLERDYELTVLNPHPTRAVRFLRGHAREAQRLAHLLERRDFGDAFLTISSVKAQGKGLDGVGKLAGMYRGFAKRLRLDCRVLDDHCGPEELGDSVTLQLSGAGAHAMLGGEDGLHQLAIEDGSGRSRWRKRELVRVEVLPVPKDRTGLAAAEVRCEVETLRAGGGRVGARPQVELRLLHIPTMTAVNAWTDASPEEARERLERLLLARIQATRSAEPGPASLVRRYRLGDAPLVRDRRSGVSTGRLRQVLEGELEPFLWPLAD